MLNPISAKEPNRKPYCLEVEPYEYGLPPWELPPRTTPYTSVVVQLPEPLKLNLNKCCFFGFGIELESVFMNDTSSLVAGAGVYPATDRWDNEFSASCMPERWKLAGQRIAGPYIGIMDGFQSDLEFTKKIFYLKSCSEAPQGL